jgi:glycosyltransferase involved in cell wall biosynthesis
VLERRTGCTYVPQQPVGGLRAELFVGHFWSFLDYCQANDFERRVAVYPVADPTWTRATLGAAARELGVPMPEWDLPPASFDHRATFDAADAVLVVGNRATLETFPPEDRPKIRLVNYAPDERLRPSGPEWRLPPRGTACYAATHCDLRKGFMDVLDTWAGLGEHEAELHVVGAIRPPWDALLAAHRPRNLRYHGFVNSKRGAYVDLLRSCRYAYLPTYSEGQVGTLLEAVQQGCVPITTAASGLDDELLERCIVIDARDVEGQRRAIRQALAWDDDAFLRRRADLVEVLGRRHTWAGFEAAVGALLDEVLA